MHHLEFEESGLKISDMEKMVQEKKILYDHSAKQEEKKYMTYLVFLLKLFCHHFLVIHSIY